MADFRVLDERNDRNRVPEKCTLLYESVHFNVAGFGYCQRLVDVQQRNEASEIGCMRSKRSILTAIILLAVPSASSISSADQWQEKEQYNTLENPILPRHKIEQTASGMAEAYERYFGSIGDATKIGICGQDGDQRKDIREDPEMFRLAGASGRLGNCQSGGGMSPFRYSWADNETGAIKDKIFVAVTKHQFDTCRNESKIRLQPNVHFREIGYSKDYWLKGYRLEKIERSMKYFSNHDTDLVLFEVESSFSKDRLPDDSERIILPIITHLKREKLPEYFRYNASIVIASFKDIAEKPSVRFYEIGGYSSGSVSTRQISELANKKIGLMATNHTGFSRASGSPMYLANNKGQLGLFGILKGSAAFPDDKINNPVVRKDCHKPEYSISQGTKFIPALIIVDFLRLEYGEPAGPVIDFQDQTTSSTR